MTEAHYLSMIVIGIGSFFFGMLPMWISFRGTRSYPLFLSLILCLGAGVLLATSLVHMLTEVQEKLKLSAQLYFCAGFLILYIFDEISHYCLGNKKPEVHSITSEEERFQTCVCSKRVNYGTIPKPDTPNESSNLLYTSNNIRKLENIYEAKHHISQKDLRHDENGYEANADEAPSHSRHYQDQVAYIGDADKPCSSNPVAKTGLLIALLIHSILEGISIGVQTKISQIFLILGAVSFHKVVLSFCLGLELHSSKYNPLNLMIAILIFSIGSPIGIFIGMTVTSQSDIFSVDAQLQAVAAGSLLYVAAFEVLPRERFKWQHKSNHKAAGIFQLIFLLIGFLCITVLHLFLDPSHDNEQIPHVTKSGY